VGGSLYLNSVTSLPEGFNPTVGGSLYLNSVTSLPEGFNPTVGWSLYTKNKSEYLNNIPKDYVFSWQDGKYIKVDGMFTEVLKKRGNVYHVRKIGSKDTIYLVTNGEGAWSHGATLQEARDDLIYKVMDKSKDDYKDFTLESVMTFEEAVTCYRVITGACSLGVKDFVENRLKDKKKIFSVKDIIEVTAGEYGSEAFKMFFNN
jgi:hypothetical protein